MNGMSVFQTSRVSFENMIPLESDKEDELKGDIEWTSWNAKGSLVLLLLHNSEIAKFVVLTPGDTIDIKQPQ